METIIYKNCMAKKNEGWGFWEGLLTIGAIIGGAWLTIEIAKAFSKEVTYYQCPRCKYFKLEWGTKICPNCNANLKWPETKQENNQPK